MSNQDKTIYNTIKDKLEERNRIVLTSLEEGKIGFNNIFRRQNTNEDNAKVNMAKATIVKKYLQLQLIAKQKEELQRKYYRYEEKLRSMPNLEKIEFFQINNYRIDLSKQVPSVIRKPKTLQISVDEERQQKDFNAKNFVKKLNEYKTVKHIEKEKYRNQKLKSLERGLENSPNNKKGKIYKQSYLPPLKVNPNKYGKINYKYADSGIKSNQVPHPGYKIGYKQGSAPKNKKTELIAKNKEENISIGVKNIGYSKIEQSEGGEIRVSSEYINQLKSKYIGENINAKSDDVENNNISDDYMDLLNMIQ